MNVEGVETPDPQWLRPNWSCVAIGQKLLVMRRSSIQKFKARL